MTCKYINLSSSPYDDTTVSSAYQNSGCPGVGNHFELNLISVGDCIEIDGLAYHVTAVKVLCSDSQVYLSGDPGESAADHTHSYGSSPVVIKFWLSPMPLEELSNCSGYP